MSVDALIDDLAAALVATGAPAPGTPADARPLRELEAELAPLRLPPALRRFWERVDPRHLALDLYPPPADPTFSLNGWRRTRDSAWPEPAGLFPWCYESHNHLVIELEAPGAAVGTIFEWGFGDATYRLRFACLEDWLELAASAVRAGTTRDVEAFRLAADRRLDDRGPHPVYGRERELSAEPERWPAHWAPVMKLARRRPPPRFPERRVAEVLDARRQGAVQATVRGSHFYTAFSEAGTRILLTDGTGVLDVLCPGDVRGLGYLELPTVCVELEAEAWRGPRPAGAWFGVSYGDLLERFPPAAIAVGIRPSD